MHILFPNLKTRLGVLFWFLKDLLRVLFQTVLLELSLEEVLGVAIQQLLLACNMGVDFLKLFGIFQAKLVNNLCLTKEFDIFKPFQLLD